MTPLAITVIVFACLMAGAFGGIRLAASLPEHHLDARSKEVVGLGMGLVATLAALVLGLMIATAQETFAAETDAIRSGAIDMLMLDRALKEYGPEAQPIREMLRSAVIHRLDLSLMSGDNRAVPRPKPEVVIWVDQIEAQVRALAPPGDRERELRTRALDLVEGLATTRWQALEVARDAIPTTFLVILVFWLTALFGGFGLFAARNSTVVVALIVCAASVSAAIYLILEMSDPIHGLVKVSAEPLRLTLDSLAK